MSTADPIWTESKLGTIVPSEHDFQEFKGSEWLYSEGSIKGDFAAALSKQISAFANGAGGRLFVGIDDFGNIDGGVPIDVKNGTRSWLEDIIPQSVDPPLSKFNVFEVLGLDDDSAIRADHGVYVIDVSPSQSAPHQALDRRYYLRIAGKSRPMGHVHVLDVLRRTRHPRVRVTRVGPYGAPQYVEDDPRGPKVLLCFQAYITNEGRYLATHVGAEVVIPRPLVSTDARNRILADREVRLTQHPGRLVFFRYHPNPLFPSQEVFFHHFWINVHAGNLDLLRAGCEVTWRVYADDAPAHVFSTPLSMFKVVRRAVAWVDRQLRLTGDADSPD